MKLPFTKFERALMWYAVEGTYVFELRWQPEDLSAVDEVDYRHAVIRALARLSSECALVVYGSAWRPHGVRITADYSPLAIAKMLEDDSAWDEHARPLMYFVATEVGRASMEGEPRYLEAQGE